MPDLATYEGLKAAIEDYMGRGDLHDRIPVFIALAEKRMNRELRLRCMEMTATAAVPAGAKFVELPERRVDGDWRVFMELRDLTWKSGGEVKNLTYTTPDEYNVLQARTGMPGQYTIISNNVWLLPVPDHDGELRITYYGEVPPLSDVQTTNNVLKFFPDIYLYGTLLESGAFTRGSAPLDLWQKYYQAAITAAEKNEQRARFTANLTMKPTRRI